MVPGAIQSVDDTAERHLIRVEGNAESVRLHVGRNGLNITDLFDGLTGPRRRSASDDPRCFQDVSDAFRNGAPCNTDGGYQHD